jgi:hypothetical protein
MSHRSISWRVVLIDVVRNDSRPDQPRSIKQQQACPRPCVAMVGVLLVMLLVPLLARVDGFIPKGELQCISTTRLA